ncbi:MAG: hypothetical protein H6613_08435 [Ignavibacteriales bacterium]|nr:hypothetical protein [Ignavibacteriales bacterium]
MDKSNTPKDVVEVVATLSRENFDDIIKSMNIFDNANANILFDEISVGKWNLSIEAFNNDNYVIYSGNTEVNVLKGTITPISLQLNPTTGSIFVNVTWEQIRLKI